MTPPYDGVVLDLGAEGSYTPCPRPLGQLRRQLSQGESQVLGMAVGLSVDDGFIRCAKSRGAQVLEPLPLQCPSLCPRICKNKLSTTVLKAHCTVDKSVEKY